MPACFNLKTQEFGRFRRFPLGAKARPIRTVGGFITIKKNSPPMPGQIILTCPTGNPESSLEESILLSRPRAMGIASAFVTVYGAEWAVSIAERVGSRKCRLIAGIDHAITHPKALEVIKASGWELRLGVATAGIFPAIHPSLVAPPRPREWSRDPRRQLR
jgi:hypothetical protein